MKNNNVWKTAKEHCKVSEDKHTADQNIQPLPTRYRGHKAERIAKSRILRLQVPFTTPASVFASWNVLSMGRDAADTMAIFRMLAGQALACAGAVADSAGRKPRDAQNHSDADENQNHRGMLFLGRRFFWGRDIMIVGRRCRRLWQRRR